MISDKNNRFIFTLPPEQARLIKRIAYIDNSSVAEVIRKAIGKYTDERKSTITEEELIKEFWGNTIRNDNGCLEWTGALSGTGYGINRTLKGETGAHRISYTVSFGEIPSNMLVCHKCDNPKCIEPKHLFLGTHADNQIDKAIKGRGNQTGKKLNGQLAAQIIRLYHEASGMRVHHLAKKFGVGENTISRILTKKSYMNEKEVIEMWDLAKERNWYIRGEN